MSNKSRYISSVVYVVALIALVVLKWLVPTWGALGFDGLFCAISVIGCLEFLRVVKVVPFLQRALSIAFCASAPLLFMLCEMTGVGGYIPVGMLFVIYSVALIIISLTAYDGANDNTAFLSMGAAAYCGLLSCVFCAINHLAKNSAPLVLLTFLTVMLCDSFAYVFGRLLKKWLPLRLAPKISPNKTVIGFVGGVLGGVLGGVIAYYLWFGLSRVAGEPLVISGNFSGVVAFVLIGFVGAIIGQAGDLFESYIKRRCDVKDSGNLIPGHGGVLDRFDSMLFCGVLVLIASFILVI